ncbi:hypothetical protein LMG3458_02647 [Achromobacter deleyi]|uniref:Uncharacterized protein n=1 Tax=Achromobacter deleyi TaxID=1353891 RepID=A0A6S6ZYG0_9BURK|nr:hypothetical protein [Achromobacter deleyi]CAB3700802.1 hypothetical protein LMG3458_02647 [Achromobacter deleyi]CAB3850174.1 hypothetical protein LMG3481_01717 [Achromobacter deleyi]CAB3869557.1 hypothetical protein LMG3412_02681 [Achromobacter deleyi]CAB3872956.1 hypothetical protein LMG3482_02885 [Achromobacter deleyi]
MDGIRRARGLPRPTLSYHATDVPDIFIGMALEARVPVDAATAFAMNVELAAQMQRQGIDPHPRFAVLFSRFEA